MKKNKWLKKECTLYERVMIRSALSFWKWEWKSERTHFFSNEWELSEAQKISERWTRWQTKTICSSLYYYLYLKHNNYKSVSQLRVYDSWKQISLSPRNAAYCSIRINWQFRLMCQTNNIKLESNFTLKFKKSGCLLSVNAHKKLSAFFAWDENAVCF